jgi:serine/threonine protein kinase
MQLAAAMAYMHERGVIHGDLSRANILLADSEDSTSGFDVKVTPGDPWAALLTRLRCLHLLQGCLPLGRRAGVNSHECCRHKQLPTHWHRCQSVSNLGCEM